MYAFIHSHAMGVCMYIRMSADLTILEEITRSFSPSCVGLSGLQEPNMGYISVDLRGSMYHVLQQLIHEQASGEGVGLNVPSLVVI